MNAASKQAQPAPALSILVADDEMDTVLTLAAILADEGHAVHTITHGSLVMDAVQRFKPNVCVLDIEMPGKDGYAVAREIVKEFGDKQQPRPLLIAISGRWKSQTDRMLARMVGFDHFLVKPADPQDIIKVLYEKPRFI
jgi:DNA-binding response OmpR family regulator